MTTDGAVGGQDRDPVWATGDRDSRRLLVCSPRMPAEAGHRCVDVRPGPAAGFAGGRVKLPLKVAGAGRRIRIPWIDRAELDTRIQAMLASQAAGWIRFGDRSSVRRLIGPGNAAAVEHRLADTAEAVGAPLVTWTSADPAEVNRDPYDVVVERATADA